MKSALACVLLLAVAAAAAPGHFAEDPFVALESMSGSAQHKSWCTFKASAAKVWCKAKAGASFDAIKRKVASDNCDYAYNLAIQACPARRLSNKKQGRMAETAISDEGVERRLDQAGQKHKSWCSFKAAVANKWCQTKAVMTTDSIKRKVNLDNCAYSYNLALQACPARRLDKLLTAASQKHKSWCTFKAAAGRTWCKTKALSFNAANRNAGFIACDNAYNLSVAQCAQRRLMKDFEKAIQSGNAHEGWCEFKNRSQWLWCKATKSINLNAQARSAALAQCDANYNAGNAACQNAKLLAAPSVNVNGYTIAPGN